MCQNRNRPNTCLTYRHDALQQSGVRFGWYLPFHWPFLHNRRDLGIIHVEDAEAGHVDTAEAIWLQVNGHQVLLGGKRNRKGSGLVCWHVEHLCFPAVLSGCFLLTLKENGAAADLTGAILRPKRVSAKEERSSFQCQIRSFKCSL